VIRGGRRPSRNRCAAPRSQSATTTRPRTHIQPGHASPEDQSGLEAVIGNAAGAIADNDSVTTPRSAIHAVLRGRRPVHRHRNSHRSSHRRSDLASVPE
jgi:hypothetical protein